MGWIKLDRQIMDNALWFSEPFTRAQAWVDLLLLASHNDETFLNKKGIVTKLKRGQLITSIPILMKRWKWSRGKVDRFLSMLVGMEMIHRVGTASGTTLTIVNYSKFQNRRNANETTNGTANGTANETTDGTLSRNNKEIKEDKKSQPLSYWEDRERAFRELEEWTQQGEDDEQS